MRLVDDMVVTLHGAVGVADSRVDELSGQLASRSVEVISVTSTLYNLEDVRNKSKLDHGELLQKLYTESKSSEDCIGAERDGAPSRVHGVLRSIRGIFKAANERNSGCTDTMNHLRIFSKKGLR